MRTRPMPFTTDPLPTAYDLIVSRPTLVGRRAECEALDRVLTDALRGRSRVIVLRGEAGVGKSALLGYLADRAEGWRRRGRGGVESEMELAYGGLHQLCAPLLDRLDRLPGPQRDALATAFGLSAGPPPDRFLVGLATLTLLAEAPTSSRSCASSTTRSGSTTPRRRSSPSSPDGCSPSGSPWCAPSGRSAGSDVLAGLPTLPVEGLSDDDARALLLDNLHGPARRRGLRPDRRREPRQPARAARAAAHRGTPRTSPAASACPAAAGRRARSSRATSRRLGRLPADTRLLVLAAAAEPLGDARPALPRRRCRSGSTWPRPAPRTDAGLLTGCAGASSSPTRSCAPPPTARRPPTDRRRVHHALADATDAETDPDRRAWHRARAASAAGRGRRGRARALGRAGRRRAAGLAAAAAFLERATQLTPDPRRARRACAGRGRGRAPGRGAGDSALRLLAEVEAGSADDGQRARARLLRGRIAFASSRGREAPPLLLDAARQLEARKPALASETHLEALVAAAFVGRLAGDVGILQVAQAARRAPAAPDPVSALDLLLDGSRRPSSPRATPPRRRS